MNPKSSAAAYKWISLGGWCGPSQMLAKLGTPRWEEQLPFDAARCTMDGLVHFAADSEKLCADPDGMGFFPTKVQRPTNPSSSSKNNGLVYPYDPVSIWLLFRAQHTAITHFDINTKAIQDMYAQRLQNWHRFVTGGGRGSSVNMLRTSLAVNPLDEIRVAPRLLSTLDKRGGGGLVDNRLVLVLHQQPTDQGAAEVLQHSAHLGVHPDDERVSVWSLPHAPGGGSLFDRCHDGYKEIIERTSDPAFWNPRAGNATNTGGGGGSRLLSTANIKWTTYKEISHVEGVPAFRGSCVGFGSTLSSGGGPTSSSVCAYCGSTDGHAVLDPTMYDSGKEWSDDDSTSMATILFQQGHVGGGNGSETDIVAAVEAVASSLGRSANECLPRVEEFLQLFANQ